jgi:hypothetical protein
MRSLRPNLPRHTVAIVLAIAIAIPSFALFCFSPLADSDVGWHLTFGDYIVRHHSIPSEDVFRFTPQESPLHLHGWLSQVVFHLLERAGGLGFFRFGTSLVMLATLGLLARLIYEMTRNAHLTALGVLVFILTSVHLFHPRARIMTPPLFLLAFEMLALDGAPLPARRLLGLFLLAVLWMNLHAEATILPIFIVVLMLSEVLARPFPRRRLVSLALAAALTFAATFVSPLGASWLPDTIQNYRLNRENSWEWFDLFSYQEVLNHVFAALPAEQHPLYVHLLGYPFSLAATILVAAAYLASLFLRPKGLGRQPGVLVNFWALFLAFNMQRNSWLLFIPIASAASNLSLWLGREAPMEWRFATRRKGSPPAVSRRWQGLAATATVLVATVLTFRPVVHPATWLEYDDDGWDARMLPTKAAAFLEAAALHGNVFAPAEWGGYLIHERPDLLVFMHGHWAEAPHTYADYRAILEQRTGFADLLDRYGATHLVVPPAWGGTPPNTQWVEVFRNVQSRVYVRRNDAMSLASVEAYYRALGIPFSPSAGFDPNQARAAAPTWAEAFRLGMS